MPGIHSPSYAAFPGMVPPCVQQGVAKTAIRPPVFAAGAFLADGKQQAVAHSYLEVFVWHGHNTIHGWKQKGAGPGSTMRPDVGGVSIPK